MSRASDAPDHEDTSARLIEADALLAAGDPRGELIVIQCELDARSNDRARGIALRRQEQQLLALHADAWADLEGLATDVVFRRGYVEEAKIDVRTFASRERELWQRAPRLERVRLHGFRHHSRVTPDARSMPLLAREVCYWLERILRSQRLRNFEVMDPVVEWSTLGQVPYPEGEIVVSDAVVDWLVDTDEHLALTGLALPDVAPETIRKLNRCPKLEDLRLSFLLDSRNPFHESDVGELRPRRLSLTTPNGGSADAIPSLLRTSLVERVTDLEVTSVADALPFAHELRVLRGAADDLEPFASAPVLEKLEELELTIIQPVASELSYEPLLESSSLPLLRVLRLVGEITEDDARRLLASPLGRRLEAIEFRGMPQLQLDTLRTHDWDGVILGPLTERR